MEATLFTPELVILLSGLVLFAASILGASTTTTWRLAVMAGIAATVGAIWSLPLSGEAFYPGIYRIDTFSQSVKVVLAAGYLLVILGAREPLTLRDRAWSELPLFLSMATLGMMMMVSATELLTLYIAMELAAYPMYISVALHRNRDVGGESSTKYMVQGMMASAVSLYGMSFIFGLTGSTYFDAISAQIGSLAGTPLFWFGMVLLLAGFLFKLAVVPFHFWAPDTYEASPHEVTTFIASVSKVAAIALLCRIVSLIIPAGVDAAGLQQILMWFSIAAMTLGNLAALRQGDLKRLLGYSAVAHAGYALIGVQTLSAMGLTAALFYGVGYAAMSLTCFLVVAAVGHDQDKVSIESMSGLWQRSPSMALVFLIGLLGLIGLPPTVGFIGKWFLFAAAIQQGQFALVLIAAINATIALYYYLLVLRQIYLVEASADATTLRWSPALAVSAATGSVVVVVMGILPSAIWDRAAEAIAVLLG
ncbi:MAG: NADH-quinone oxidoreductase subunit N [Gemmatimonadetes bacterium]|jgi:NADH-quinone oxidoreductase subunit N|nr:NADH-quinone oxidoreductase subunit N [Gemmatimonadota bacterium]MBT6148997.1 NADH-quinone oxidoreductase subunit N [Gemmatimonadota bacterium]MBT7860539.1 NADH-quinone oxidoreductase subunit N [Gemmatimonadota bacterium]